jgi:hypothetical protein
VDRTRQVARVVFRDVRVPASARLPGGGEALTAMSDRGSVALAADALGAARRALDMAAGYAKQREQFGRPIGSFQAIKHKLADMYLLVQGAAVAVEGAAEALDAGGDARRPVAVAASYARDAAVKVTGDAIQVHGGIGYTWEHDCHRLFKRAKFDEAFLGDPPVHRERLAALMLGRLRGYAAFSRMWIPQAEPRPITWARPTLALWICRGPASPRRCWQISQTLAIPVAPMGWPLDWRPPDTLTGRPPSRQVAPLSNRSTAPPGSHSMRLS